MNKTILRLTDLLLSENPFHFIYFLKKNSQYFCFNHKTTINTTNYDTFFS